MTSLLPTAYESAMYVDSIDCRPTDSSSFLLEILMTIHYVMSDYYICKHHLDE